jgi:pimeloyl-ACP methyl ester carboxylesterase/DNA-binding CsgD family transcriptional regulator
MRELDARPRSAIGSIGEAIIREQRENPIVAAMSNSAAPMNRVSGGKTADAAAKLPPRVTRPVIQYAKTNDGVNIAYYVIGAGPALVYLTPGSHLEREWQYPEQRAWLERLAARNRVIRLDCRGSGLSDRVPDFELKMLPLDVEAVVRREGLTRFALLGGSASMAMLYACAYQDKVSRLILWCPYTNYRDLLETSPALRAVLAAGTQDWHSFTEFVAGLLSGWAETGQSRRYAAYMRECFVPDRYMRFVERFKDLDLTSKLGELTMPMLVMQPKDTAFSSVEVARKVAMHAPLAQMLILEGSSSLPFLGDTDAILAAIDRFLSEPSEWRPDGLTERELEILTMLARGTSSSGIATALSISTRTVDRHITNIYRKVGAHNRAEATAYAYERGIASVV